MKSRLLVLNSLGHKYLSHADGRPFLNPDVYDLVYFSTEKNSAQTPPGFCEREVIVNFDDHGSLVRTATDLHGNRPFDRVLVFSEKTVLLGGVLRDTLGVPGMDYEISRRFRDKCHMKFILGDAGVRVPEFAPLSLEGALRIIRRHGKAVCKPRDGLGARSVSFLACESDVRQALEVSGGQAHAFEVEEFISGPLFHVDSIVKDGVPWLTSVSRYGEQPSAFAEGWLSSAMLDASDPLFARFSQFNARALAALGLRDGVAHLEAFLTPHDEIVFCEVGARAGGAGVIPAVESAWGVNLLEAWALLEAGAPLPVPTPSAPCAGWVLFTGGAGRVTQVSGLEDFPEPWFLRRRIRAKPGQVRAASASNAEMVADFVIEGANHDEVVGRLAATIGRFTLVTEA